MRWNKYLPFAILYFFLNTAGLPLGLTFTALLAPFFYLWVLLKRKEEVLLPFICCLLPFLLGHIFMSGVDNRKYAFAILNIFCVYIFCQAFYTWLKRDERKEVILKNLLVLNTIMCLAAVVFYFTPLSGIFWIRQDLTDNVDQFMRLKMLTYEASYYAVVFAPLFLFFFLQYVLKKDQYRSRWLLLMLFLPFVLSFSLGVIICLLIAGLLVFAFHFRSLAGKRRVFNGFLTFSVAGVLILLAGFIFFPDNPLFIRLENIFAGKDTSSSGRTADAFLLARNLLEQKNLWWGIGAGQLSLEGGDLIRGYYLYHHSTPVAIPNAAAETLALFGWIGFATRLIILTGLFFVTRVWTNYYRLTLFFFMVIYQFMGSYITSIPEYVIWILCFTNAFPVFDVKPRKEYRPALA
ncbi:MAG: hypothetical protein JNM88_19920 [Chitinophagaceae bacterium]|nr:hypothetical protein [Chitinophagaceae bacterium]